LRSESPGVAEKPNRWMARSKSKSLSRCWAWHRIDDAKLRLDAQRRQILDERHVVRLE
jgi:hypothetical protein